MKSIWQKSLAFRTWLSTFSAFFMSIVSYEGLRRLHALGQPVLGMAIDAAGVSALTALLLTIWQRPPREEDKA